MHRPSPSRLLLALLVAVLVVAGLQGTADAATTRTLTVKTSTTGAVAKGGVTFSGVLSRSPKGSVVTVQRKSGKKWVAAKTTKTKTAAGSWSVRVAVPAKVGTYVFRAVAPKKGALRAATSRTVAVSALRKTSFTKFTTSPLYPKTVKAGQNAGFSGALKPFVTGSTIVIQRQSGPSWVTLTTTKVKSNGTFAVTAKVVNSGIVRAYVGRAGLNAPAKSLSGAIVVDPVIGTTALPDGTQGVPYSYTLTNLGKVKGEWTATGLPAGLAVAKTTGVISGTPSAAVTDKAVTIGFRDPLTGQTAASKTLPLTVANPGPPTPPVITTASLPDAEVGQAYSKQLAATGGAGTWSATNLPDGLSVSTAGLISGVPDPIGSVAVTKQVSLTYTKTSGGLSDTDVLPLKVNPPPPPPKPVILTKTLPDGRTKALIGGATTPYSAQLYVSGGVAGTWSESGLPAGLMLNPTSGAITGAPTQLNPSTTNVTFNFTENGNPSPADAVTIPIKIANAAPPAPAVQVGAGGQYTCRIKSDQTLWCWGYDDAGQLGDGGTLISDPTGVLNPVQIGSATDWSGLTVGRGLPTERHTCALRGTAAYCWGSDTYNELGSASTAGSSTSPVLVDGGLAWANLSAGFTSTCGVTTTGGLYCWGDNALGQLGTGGGSVGVPTKVGTANSWTSVSVGYNSACGTRGDGSLWCWGLGGRGQLGNGTRDSSTPAQVSGDQNWTSVTVGSGYACGLRSTGAIACWGTSADGHLGNGTTVNDSTTDALVPTQVGSATTWTSISAGDSTTCATNDAGQLWCWGKNVNGQVGNGAVSATGQSTPVRVGTATDWASVSTGATHSCAVKDTGAIQCFGNNNKGQLGTGNTTEAHAPVAVIG